jgi:hypothetical protein
VGLWSGFFLNEGILTYFLTPRSPPNSPILFSVFTSVVYEEDGVLSSYRLLLQNCTASSIFIFNGFCPAISSNWNCWYNESVICPNLSWKRIELYLVGDWWSWHWLLGNFFFLNCFSFWNRSKPPSHVEQWPEGRIIFQVSRCRITASLLILVWS